MIIKLEILFGISIVINRKKRCKNIIFKRVFKKTGEFSESTKLASVSITTGSYLLNVWLSKLDSESRLIFKPGSQTERIKFDFFLLSVHEKINPNQLVLHWMLAGVNLAVEQGYKKQTINC